jgi:hypothetical protein
MSKVDEYRNQLQQLNDWKAFLLRNSGLPGPRGNLELAQAAAELASMQQIEALLSIPAERAPENSAEVFLVFCGISALGMQVARGQRREMKRLQSFASDSRWRVREAVVIGLQYVGDADMLLLLREMDKWKVGNWYEKRAVAAALAEPRLLKDSTVARHVLQILDEITAKVEYTSKAREESFKTLRQSMGYCWSVAVVALPEEGKHLMEKWMASTDAEIRWIMRENLKKNRLARMDAKWVSTWAKKMELNL